jgi:adenylosuccinate synthase
LRAYIIVDLGFGDSGKGLLTDFLVRQLKADIVVRYNGGAQAAHNVVTADGRHHTFSQFGSGTFNPHVKTYLSRHVVIHPTALLVEGDMLEARDVPNPFLRLRISDQALVITPFHQAANRLREIARGSHRHGSCGVGVGEAVDDAIRHADERILAGDLYNPALLRRKLRSIRDRKRDEILVFCKENSHDILQARDYEMFKRDEVIDNWISYLSRIRDLGLITSDDMLERWLHESENVVFEGAQGVLLDADAGFHPYTTWSNCTTTNADELINEIKPDARVFKIGVIRSHAVRHGPGPLPTETDTLSSVINEHNQQNEWQGAVRYGWFDAVLTRYALSLIGGVDSLLVTHMDMLPKLNEWKYCFGYKDGLEELLAGFHPSRSLSLEERAELTQALLAVTPEFNSCKAEDKTVIREIESLLGQPVGLISHGPRAEDVQILNALPL